MVIFSNPLTAEPFAATALSSTDSLNIAKPGSGHGIVTSNPPGINCGGTCTANFTPGSSVTLTATPDAHSTFRAWVGACAGQGNPCTLTKGAASQTVAAYFQGAAISDFYGPGIYPHILKSDGTLWRSGFYIKDNVISIATGVLTRDDIIPQNVFGMSNVVSVTGVGDTSGRALKSDGTVWTWEWLQDEWGDPITPTPTPTSLANVITMIGGSWFLKSDGTVWTWIRDATPTQVSGISNVIDIDNINKSKALKSDGTVLIWDIWDDGTTPIQLSSPSNIIDINGFSDPMLPPMSRASKTYALKDDGTVWVWIESSWDDDMYSRPPTLVSGLANVIAISGSMALKSDGTVWSLYGSDPPSPILNEGGNNFNVYSNSYRLTINSADGGYTATAPHIAGTNYNPCSTTDSPPCVLNEGSQIKVRAYPLDGYTFTGWSGDCAGTDTICTIVMDADKSITPIFTANTANTFNLILDKAGTGTGTITATGIDCGSDCSETYAAGTSVTLTATPATGSTFAGWSGACSGTGACQVTMSEARTVTATFNTRGGGGLPLTITATHTAPANYPVGGSLTLTSEFAVPAGTSLVSLVWRPTLPTGWTLQSVAGDGTPQVQGNAILFTEALTTNPLRFTYQVAVPASATGTQTLSADVEYQTLGMVNPMSMLVTPSVLQLRSSTSPHQVDYRDPPWQIDATEASRVLAYWRAGSYHVDPAGADGYAVGPGSTYGVRHAADFEMPYWQIGGTEATRVLSFWRAGGYHVDPIGLDGYAPGLVSASLHPAAQASAPQVTHQIQDTAPAGGWVNIQVTIHHAGDLISLLARPELPSGWTITEVTGEGSPQVLGSEILLTAQDLPNPLTFQYRVQIPATAQGTYHLRTSLEHQSIGMVNPATLYAAENPLSITVGSGSHNDSATTLITHYYTSILGREPEATGLVFWLGLIAEKQAQGLESKPVFREMANAFFNSTEYLENHTGDSQFITDLYRTFFQREPDQGGIDFWLGQLAAGTPRHQAMGGFLYSPEFTTFMENLGF